MQLLRLFLFVSMQLPISILPAQEVETSENTQTISRAQSKLPKTLVFDDAESRAIQNAQTLKLDAQGKLIKARVLSAQLTRTSTALPLKKPNAAAPVQKLSELFANCRPSVFSIGEVRDCAGCGKQHVNNVATGFAISSDGIIVTNYHVVASIDPEFRVVASTSDGKTYPVTEVVAANQNDDLAAIRIAGSSFRALPLSENNATGTRIAIISQPSRNQFYLSEGIVSRHYLEHVDASTPSRHIMGVSAEFAIGSSGGPVIDLQGNAIGVVAATADLDGQMVLRTCVPAQRIMSLFNPAAKPTEPKRDDPLALERACLRATHAAFVALMQKQEDLTPEEFSKRFQDLHASMLAAIKLCPNDPIATGYLKAMQRDTLQK